MVVVEAKEGPVRPALRSARRHAPGSGQTPVGQGAARVRGRPGGQHGGVPADVQGAEDDATRVAGTDGLPSAA
eukprot:1374422-Prymnesium_polylepis.1